MKAIWTHGLELQLVKKKKAMSDDDWYLIDDLIQNVIISRSDMIESLKRNVENKKVMDEILEIAMKLMQK